jgi:hypothetical protein
METTPLARMRAAQKRRPQPKPQPRPCTQTVRKPASTPPAKRFDSLFSQA